MKYSSTKFSLLFVTLALLAVLFMISTIKADDDDFMPDFKPDKNNHIAKFCGRKFKADMEEDGRELVVTSLSNCSGNRRRFDNNKKNDTQKHDNHDDDDEDDHRANILRFVLSADKIPQFAIRALNTQADAKSNFAARLGFDRIAEVVPPTLDANTTFDITANNVVRVVLLDNDDREGTDAWSEISCNNSTSLSDLLETYNVDTPLVCSTSLTLVNMTNPLFRKMTLQAIITPKQLEMTLPNGLSKTKKVITPNSLKLSLSIDGVRYTNSSTRLAIGSFFISKGNGLKKDESDDDSDIVTPETESQHQGVFKIVDATSPLGGGFFSWDKYVSMKTVTGAYASKGLLTSRGVADEEQVDAFESLDTFEDDDYRVFRLWFVPVEQVDNLFWDPSTGAGEVPLTNNAVRSIGQFSAVLFVMLMSVLCLL